ncbi:MAG: RrF2 family transcriptional regulator [Bacteroidia bacterium]
MLTKKAKYALNALVFLAKREVKHAGVPITSAQIAKENNMPSKFLEGILSDLKKASILRSIHGKGGGYLLQKKPNEIQMVDIIRMFDGAVGLIPCATYTYFQPCEECEDVENCKIRWTFKELRDQTVEFMKDKTVADLI